MSRANIQRLRNALHSIFEDTSIDEITLDSLAEYPVIRNGSPDGFCIDILSRLGDVATYDDLRYRTIGVEGTRVRVATPKSLYWLKDIVRPEDKRDTTFLKELIEVDK